MKRKDLMENLELASAELVRNGITNKSFYIAGGSSLSLWIESFRATYDIDIINNFESAKIRQILNTFKINDDVATCMDPNFKLLYGYFEETSDFLVEFDSIRWYKVWPEVILMSKLHSSSHLRDKDKEDLSNSEVLKIIDKKRLYKTHRSIAKFFKAHWGGQIANNKEEWAENASELWRLKLKYEKHE